MRFFLLSFIASVLAAEELPVITSVEHQPLAAQVQRVVEALDMLGEPLPGQEKTALAGAKTVQDIQKILDPHCLVGVNINPESRVKVQEGPAKAELMEQGWRTFLVKVHNEAGVTAALAVDSPNAGRLAGTPEGLVGRRFLDIQVFNKQPLRPTLSGLEVEYRILQLYSRNAGRREGKLSFNVGQGTQDLGFRNDVDILFQCKPATKLTFRVLDFDDRPTTGAFLIRDDAGRVYPSQAKRLAPDFAFHPQIYRADGEIIKLPEGSYTVEFSRGPESLIQKQTLKVAGKPQTVAFQVKRWIDPSDLGWW